MADLRFSCRCGTLNGHVTHASPRGGNHIVCHCADCVRTLVHFGIEANQQDGVDLFQTTPDHIKIDSGKEHLALLTLSPKGAYRWYAKCCDTPFFNSPNTPRFAFATVLTRNIDRPEALGRVIGHTFLPTADGKTRHKNITRPVISLMIKAGAALISGRWRDTPFFDPETREPVAAPTLAPKNAGRAG
ncbi:DUF6151 family protein [Fontisubflavum oceani]|uniref:DUF6151 family protein n=1 Tax=Fontisubflavum oceani TaxID=2978973 RepID=UPI0025B4F04E|nr:DUF6151 family protein [Fontisubflavum oceani]WJY20154.1 DUF6151 family protein [Fontisubflavum oceani]